MDAKSNMSEYSMSLFQRLKPVCINVTKDGSLKNLSEAMRTLTSLHDDDIDEGAMLEYVLFPFRLNLQKRNLMKEKQEIVCFQCLQVIFSKCKSMVIRDETLFWGLNTFSLYFAPKSENQKEKLIDDDISEERQVEIMKFIQSMFIKVSTDTMTSVYQNKLMPVLGHVVSILLHMIEKEKNCELKLTSLNVLKRLSAYHIKDKHCLEVAGKCWASFLPGICMAFNRLFTKSNNISETLIVSLETFAQVICIVLNDDLNGDLMSRETTLEQLFYQKSQDSHTNDTSENPNTRTLGVERTKEWLEKTCTNMNLVFKSILPVIMCFEKVKVQIALLAFIERLLLSCMKTLSSSVMDFIDVLLKTSCDTAETLRNESNRILGTCMKKLENANVLSVKSTLNERLYSELLSLPRVMHSSSSDMKLAKLQKIKGYMEFYGEFMKEALSSHAFLQRFINSLIHVLELETDHVNLVEEQTSMFRQAIDVGPETYDNRFYRKSFKYFRSISIHKLIKEIVYHIFRYASMDLLIDYVLEQSQNSYLRKQAFLILNEGILSVKEEEADVKSSVVEFVLSSYLTDELMKLPVTNNFYGESKILESDELLVVERNSNREKQMLGNSLPFEALNSNIQLICILLEGISNCAEVMGEDFNVLMMQTLYPLLEKVGSLNAAVSHTAIETLNNIVRFCKYKDVSDLIYQNSDYLLNSITLQFRRLVYGASAPAVLCVVLRFCDASLIPIISDVIGDVFDVLDEYQEEVADDMLMILKDYNMAVEKCYGAFQGNHSCDERKPQGRSKFKPKDVHGEVTHVSNDSVPVGLFVEKYCELNIFAQGVANEEDYETIDSDREEDNIDDNVEQDEEEKEEQTPIHYKVVITSLEKCVAFIAANQYSIRLKALDVALYGVLALRERENDLLPLIHKLWPPLISTLKDQEHVLVLKSLDVACCMIRNSGNFITKRMTTDFLPYSVRFLNDNCEALTKDRNCFTQLSKIQKKLISFLGDIVPPLDISTELFCGISSSIMAYTNCELHPSIQETAVSTLIKLYNCRPNIIWLLCQFMCVRDDLTPSYSGFKALTFAKPSDEADKYKANAMKLYTMVEKKSDIVPS